MRIEPRFLGLSARNLLIIPEENLKENKVLIPYKKGTQTQIKFVVKQCLI
jgi:hypothetical protein